MMNLAGIALVPLSVTANLFYEVFAAKAINSKCPSALHADKISRRHERFADFIDGGASQIDPQIEGSVILIENERGSYKHNI